MDTNFLLLDLAYKIDLVKGMTDCLLAKCVLSSWISNGQAEKLEHEAPIGFVEIMAKTRASSDTVVFEADAYADDDIC